MRAHYQVYPPKKRPCPDPTPNIDCGHELRRLRADVAAKDAQIDHLMDEKAADMAQIQALTRLVDSMRCETDDARQVLHSAVRMRAEHQQREQAQEDRHQQKIALLTSKVLACQRHRSLAEDGLGSLASVVLSRATDCVPAVVAGLAERPGPDTVRRCVRDCGAQAIERLLARSPSGGPFDDEAANRACIVETVAQLLASLNMVAAWPGSEPTLWFEYSTSAMRVVAATHECQNISKAFVFLRDSLGTLSHAQDCSLADTAAAAKVVRMAAVALHTSAVKIGTASPEETLACIQKAFLSMCGARVDENI